jgi:hypothetical protein
MTLSSELTQLAARAKEAAEADELSAQPAGA